MSIKNKKPKKQESSFRYIHNPYSSNDEDTLIDIFPRYMADDNKECEIDGVTYYRAAQIFTLKITGRGKMVLAALSEKMHLKIGSIIIDENENEYTVKGFEMLRFSGEIPEWYFHLHIVSIYPEYDNMGEYFAVKEF